MSESQDRSPCGGECTGRREFLRDSINKAVLLAGLASLAPLSKLAALTVGATGVVRYPLPAGDSISIDGDNEIILCRVHGEVYAFALSCPHQNTALRKMSGNKGFQCPRHKSRYQPDGTFIDGKATRNMDRLQISREANEIVVDPNIIFESDTQPAKWASALVKVG